MIKWIVLLIFALCCSGLVASPTYNFSDDSIQSLYFLEPANHFNKSRLVGVTGVWAASYGSSLYLLSTYWYTDLQGFRT